MWAAARLERRSLAGSAVAPVKIANWGQSRIPSIPWNSDLTPIPETVAAVGSGAVGSDAVGSDPSPHVARGVGSDPTEPSAVSRR